MVILKLRMRVPQETEVLSSQGQLLLQINQKLFFITSISGRSVKMLAEWAKLKLHYLSDIYKETDKSSSVDQIRVPSSHVDPVSTTSSQPELSVLSEVSGENKGQSHPTSLPGGSMSMPVIFAQPEFPRSFKKTGKKSSSDSQARVALVPRKTNRFCSTKPLPHLEPFNITEEL